MLQKTGRGRRGKANFLIRLLRREGFSNPNVRVFARGAVGSRKLPAQMQLDQVGSCGGTKNWCKSIHFNGMSLEAYAVHFS